MKSMLSGIVIVAVLASAVHAQPGQTQPGPYPPPPAQPYPPPAQPYPPPAQQPPPPMQPYQQPPPGVPPPYGYAPMQLTPEEHELLLEGEISEGAHIGGAVASFFIGFGIGQAIQGRFGDTGWIFALGTAASFTAFIIGLGQLAGDCAVDSPDCDGNGDGAVLALVGMVGVGVFHIWGIVDAIAGPSRHNRRVRDLRMRVGQPMYYSGRIQPFLSKSRDGGGFAGVTLRF